MDAVVSLLPPPYYARVESIWDDLEGALGLRGYQLTPYPHFSWQLAKAYNLQRLRPILQELAAREAPLTVRTSGMALFTGESPVIYIPVVKNPELLTLHRRVCDAIQPTASDPSSFYTPDQWMPHISLAFHDVTPANIGPLMERLAFHTYTWTMTIDNFAFLSQPKGQAAKLEFSVPFHTKA